MRILLIQPSCIVTERWSEKAAPFLPIGLASIAASLKKANHEVMLLDALTEGWEFRWRHEGGWIEIGLSEEDVAAEIRRYQPQVVGFSVPFTTQAPRLRSLARWVKAIHPEIFVVCGGNYPTAAPREVLEIPDVDLVVLGEGEITFTRILDKLKTGASLENLNGIAYRSEGGGIAIQPPLQYIENLDQLPLPAYDLLPLTSYFKAIGKRWLPLFNTRGCQKACASCSTEKLHGKRARYESVEYTLKKIRLLNDNYGVQSFYFDDNNLFSNKLYAAELFDRIIDEKLKIQWIARSGVDPRSLDDDLLNKMRLAGGKRLHFSPDSGSRRVLRKYLARSFDPYIMEKAIQRTLDAGFKVSCHFLIGTPGETLEEIHETLKFAWKLRSLGVDEFNFSMAVPYAGTEMRSHAENMQCVLPDQEEMYTPYDGCISTEEIPAEEISVIRETADREFNNSGLVNGLLRRFTPQHIHQVLEERFFTSLAPQRIIKEAPKIRRTLGRAVEAV